MKAKNAIVFLTNHPNKNTLNFASKIGEEKYFTIYVIVDDVKEVEESENYKIIKVANENCINNGYENSLINSHIGKNVTSWDKFCFYFCEVNTEHDFVWVFEDDVFIPSIKTIMDLDKKYSAFDLVTPNIFQKTDTIMDWHWRNIIDKIDPPYYFSMVCAMGISKNVFRAIKDFVRKKKTLFFIEVLFNTISKQNKLKVIDAFEFKSIVWVGEWGLDEFLLLPLNVFHPIKNIDEHQNLRESINDFKGSNYIPTNKLPIFIKNLMK